ERVPSSENALVAASLEKQAIVSRAAVKLREAAAAAAGRRPFRLVAPWPEGRRWAVALTHDLDLVKLWPLAVAVRLLELARKGKVGMAVRAVLRSARALGRDPVWNGVQSVLEPEAEFLAHSTWFVICETPTFASIR